MAPPLARRCLGRTGLDRLRRQPLPAEPAQQAWLATVLNVGPGPAARGWREDQRRPLARVTKLISRLFHISYTQRGTSYLLHRMGWSPQVPAHRAIERNEYAHPRDQAGVHHRPHLVADGGAVTGLYTGSQPSDNPG
jgi:transposase